jgi:hypothetical protein
VLSRFGYRKLGRKDRGSLRAYLQRLSGYSRAQIIRMVSRWVQYKPLVKGYKAPVHAFARRYTSGDIELLAVVERDMGDLSGPATACVLRRQSKVFGDQRFEPLASILPSHIYRCPGQSGQTAHLSACEGRAWPGARRTG